MENENKIKFFTVINPVNNDIAGVMMIFHAQDIKQLASNVWKINDDNEFKDYIECQVKYMAQELKNHGVLYFNEILKSLYLEINPVVYLDWLHWAWTFDCDPLTYTLNIEENSTAYLTLFGCKNWEIEFAD